MAGSDHLSQGRSVRLHTSLRSGMRRPLAGAAAGVSGVAATIAVVALLMVCGGIVGFLYNVSSSQYGDTTLSTALMREIGGVLTGLIRLAWSARWAMLAVGVLGMVLAYVDAASARLPSPWADRAGLLVTLWASGAVVTGWFFAGREAGVASIAAQPEGFDPLSATAASDTATLFMAIVVSSGLAYVVWAIWRWWYDRWTGWLDVPRPVSDHAVEVHSPRRLPDREERDGGLPRLRWDTGQEPAAPFVVARPRRSPWWPLFIVGALALSMLVTLLQLRSYESVAPDITTGAVWVRDSSPSAETVLAFEKVPRRLSFTNTSGAGRLDIRVWPPGGNIPFREIKRFPLAGTAGRHQATHLDLQGLGQGDYRLEARLLEGTGGELHYAASAGGGGRALLLSLGLGLAVGSALATGAALLLLLLARTNWL